MPSSKLVLEISLCLESRSKTPMYSCVVERYLAVRKRATAATGVDLGDATWNQLLALASADHEKFEQTLRKRAKAATGVDLGDATWDQLLALARADDAKFAQE